MRLKIFLFVSILFVVSIFGIIGLRFYQSNVSIHLLEEQIAQYVNQMDEQKRRNILELLNVEIVEIENQISALFEKISTLDWEKRRFLPQNENIYVNHWEDAANLIISNSWLDFVQFVSNDKLKASICVRPNYLEHFFFIPYDEIINLAFVNDAGGSIKAYILVPYWTDNIKNVDGQLVKLVYEKGSKEENFLMFDVGDMLALDPKDMSVKKINLERNPLSSDVYTGHEVYLEVMNNMISSYQVIRNHLMKNQNLINMLKTPYLTREWAYENIGKDPFLDWDYEPSCARRVCEGWPSDIAEKPWMVLEGYSSRYEQNQLIWKAGELFGSGIWNFNPLGNNAPKGLCSVDRSIFQAESSFHKVYGIKMSSVVATEAIPFILDCQVDSNDFCIAHTNDVVKPKNRKGLFFTKTITFKSQDSSSSENNYSTLTIGSSLNEVLQKLALIVPGSILYVTEDGQSLFYSEDGRIYDQSEWSNIDFTNMINQPSGMIKNIKGQEFLFLHLMPIFEGKGQIFVVELKQNIFQILTQLKQQVKMLVKKLFYENLLIGFIALLVGLIILNKILKNGIKPLSYLVEITHLVSSGKLEEIQIPIKWKERKDEIGALLTSFDEMVKEMKEGRKVRSILDKVVSKDVAEKILKDGVELGGEIREVTILFADIRNFTHISESLKPEEVLEMLNSCLTVLSKVIDDFGGVIDKYIGDEIMAIFGAPVAMENSALVAIQAAKKMIEILEEWNEIRKSRNLLPLAIGISIHTGNVIAGNIGAENHLSYTVLGHNVNLASRMVDLASPMEILVTQDVYEKATKVMNVKADSLEAQMFKGISKPIALFRITT